MIRHSGLVTLCSFFFAVALGVAAHAAETRARAPVAVIDGEPISAEEFDRVLGAKAAQLEEQLYNLKREELDNLISQKLLAREAAKRNLSVSALLDHEVTSKIGLVTEHEIDAFYQVNKSSFQGDEATARPQIRAFLQQQKLNAGRSLYLKSLRSAAKITIRLQPPETARVQVSIDGAPLRGLPTAPVTIVEFSDFHCPFCKRVISTLAQLESQYGEKMKLVFRDFPIESLHPGASKSHEAARCANDQGKFWEYHDMLFTHSPKLAPDDLKRYAGQVGLDAAKFETCLSSGTHSAAVQKDLEEGKRLGITGTPAFFINGRPLSGAQPLDAFARVIDEELARAATTAR
jgi:protein-disulfide isomerase